MELTPVVVVWRRPSQPQFQQRWKEAPEAPSLTEKLLAVDVCREEEELFIFGGVAAGVLPMLHWTALLLCMYNTINWAY